MHQALIIYIQNFDFRYPYCCTNVQWSQEIISGKNYFKLRVGTLLKLQLLSSIYCGLIYYKVTLAIGFYNFYRRLCLLKKPQTWFLVEFFSFRRSIFFIVVVVGSYWGLLVFEETTSCRLGKSFCCHSQISGHFRNIWNLLYSAIVL